MTDLSRRQLLERGGGVLLGGSLLAACGGGSEARPRTAGETSGFATTNAFSGAPRPGGLLRYGMAGGAPTDSMDPNKNLSGPAFYYDYILYEQQWGASPSYEIVPVLVEEHHANARADEWTIRVKDGVEFHNGKTLSADDVMFTIRRILDPRNAAPKAGQLAMIDPRRMRKLDARTVRLELKTPASIVPESLALFASILPEGYDPDKPAGTGAFKLKSFAPGQRAEFVRFENYHGRPAHLDSITITDFASETALVNALIAGEVDMVDLSPGNARLVEREKDLHVFAFKTNGYSPFRMNMRKPPFDDVRVRQAFRLIADRRQIIDQARLGLGRVANDLYAPQDPGYARDIPQRTQDIERAKSLLRAAGQSNLSVQLTAAGVVAGMVESATVFARQAKAAGVDVRVNKVDVGTFYGRSYFDWPFAVEFYNTANYFASAQQSDGPTAAANVTGFEDREYARLYERAIGMLDAGRRRPLMHRMQEIQHERGAYIIWGFATLAYGYRNVGGITENLGVLPPRWQDLWLAR